VLPSAQRIFDLARFLVALRDRASGAHVEDLRRLVEQTPSAALEAYEHAHRRAAEAPEARERDAYAGVALTIAAAAAVLGIASIRGDAGD
jgi:hypothetical protein